jgi:hypothetical protein
MKMGTTTSLSNFDAALYSTQGIAKRPPDLGPGLLNAMLGQLGLAKDDLEE